MTQVTANSAGSPLVFVRISCFGRNPVKYTDPDGRIDKITVETTRDEYDEMVKHDSIFSQEYTWEKSQVYLNEHQNGAYYRAPGESQWQQFENKDDAEYTNPDSANVEILETILIGRKLISAGKALINGLNKSPVHLQNVANKGLSSGERGQQLINAFRGRLRLETSFESVNRSIQKDLGVKIGGAIQKPWHLVINGKEFKLSPLNPLWHFFPKK